ncbi:MAG: hypothetical protein J2P46_01805 [Zavarzinella sp.]|nr:hypothetical protein [Zavarzinella sp.]
MLRALLTFGIGGVILGALFAYHGFKERDVAAGSTQAPETISLGNLIARGPDGNANIVLTDYVAIQPPVVQRGRRNRYSGTWVAVVPKDASAPDGGAAVPKAFVYSTKARSPEEAYQRLSNPQLPGLVTNKIMTPNGDATDELQEKFPRADFATCIFIHEGREPSSEAMSALLIYGGIGAVVVGLGLLGLALVVWRKRSAEGTTGRPGRGKGLYPRGEVEDEDDRPRKRRASARDDEDDDLPRRKRRPVARDEDDDRPRRKYRDDEDDDRPRRRPRRDRDD